MDRTPSELEREAYRTDNKLALEVYAVYEAQMDAYHELEQEYIQECKVSDILRDEIAALEKELQQCRTPE